MTLFDEVYSCYLMEIVEIAMYSSNVLLPHNDQQMGYLLLFHTGLKGHLSVSNLYMINEFSHGDCMFIKELFQLMGDIFPSRDNLTYIRPENT